MMLMATFLLLTLGKSSNGVQEDLSGKMFTFPQETASAHVKISTPNQELVALSVCLRFFTDLTRDYSVFSLSVPTEANYFMIMKRDKLFEVFVNDASVKLQGLAVKLNTWQSLCCTWKSGTGLTQLWLNENPSSRKSTTTSTLLGAFTIILGQEQDTHEGGFDKDQSFVGMLSDLHMWDYVLSSEQIRKYSLNVSAANGNILNWRSMEFKTSGRIFTEEQNDENLQ